ncbi:valine--tRNA ligase [Gemmatimonadetes bacterium T265]|nr:valine--tRNA ligase [Gemmatimonadetes bacterium T265]
MSDELPAAYDAAATERAIYARWQAAGLYTAQAARSERDGGGRVPFTVLMPPPNVTAVLHVGHALNNTVQDVLARWRRMAGDEALWLPGMDHAGIATQNVVEKKIAREEGLSRYEVGREAFVERTAEFVRETGGQILDQLKAIGASADWSRTAYTLSPELSRAVREAFVRLYERGLIYKGHRVIHWCPRCMTSLSDEEAEFKEAPGRLYHLRYAVSDEPARAIVVATTRPETLFGDVAVAVNPDDERYADLVGRTVRLPLVGLDIPVIADAYVDREFGTGALKITPAHDQNDFEVGRRHGLPTPVVIDAAGFVRAVADADGRVPAAVDGMERFDARARTADLLEAEGTLVGVEAHQHAVRRCYRCDTVVEPRLSDQWFVRMAPLAAPALAAVREGTIRILPERWEAVYVHWMENIRDWNISRQLWWGHRIPVWYDDATGETFVSREELAVSPTTGNPVRQDDDVLDTWFSSWLWPVSTLGWPNEEAPDLRAFYPTDVLVTAPEILFFWVARMIMAGYAFGGAAPFHTVYLHGTVRDTLHRKMSKSLGNGIDPLEVVARYGADALRWTSVAGLGMGADVILDPEDLEKSFTPGRNFCTKLWNIGRYLLQNVGAEPVLALDAIAPERLTQADRWVLARLDAAVRDCDAALGPARPPRAASPGAEPRWPEAARGAGLRLNEYAEAARRFAWSELADWYLESTKARLAGNDADDRAVARAVLAHAFDGALRLLHPIVPFITEALWHRLPSSPPDALLAAAAWPAPRGAADASGADALDGAAPFDTVRACVEAVRQIRSDYAVPPGRRVDVYLQAAGEPLDAEAAGMVGALARADVRVADGDGTLPFDRQLAAQQLVRGARVYVPLVGLVDVAKEREKLTKELAGLDKQLGALRGRLANPGFVERAPTAVVDAERAKERAWTARAAELEASIAALQRES